MAAAVIAAELLTSVMRGGLVVLTRLVVLSEPHTVRRYGSGGDVVLRSRLTCQSHSV